MKRHAFMARDWYTCVQCSSFCTDENGRPRCKAHKDEIHYDPHWFGCGLYSTTDSGEQEVKDTIYMFGKKPKKITGCD